MSHIAVNTDHEYPIYVYSKLEDMPEEFFTTNATSKLPESLKWQIHIPLFGLEEGHCPMIECPNCPIQHECSEESDLRRFFPELLKTNPEFFI